MNSLLIPFLKTRFPSAFMFLQELDKRLDRYDKEINLSVWFMRLTIGICLVLYGIARQMGAIQVDASRYMNLPPDASEEMFEEADYNLRRITSVGSLGLGLLVLLPIILPPPVKGKESASEYIAANLLREEWNDRKDLVDGIINDEKRLMEELHAKAAKKDGTVADVADESKKEK